MSRKKAVLDAVASGAITVAEACARWQLSDDELAAWQRDYALAGVRGLRVTKTPRSQLLGGHDA